MPDYSRNQQLIAPSLILETFQSNRAKDSVQLWMLGPVHMQNFANLSRLNANILRVFAAMLLVGALGLLAACSATTPLPTGLSQRMDQSGAILDSTEALKLVNQFRASRNVGQLNLSAALTAKAQELATAYATSGKPPQAPEGMSTMRISAGYTNFAETFSGWRGSAADAEAIATPTATKMGVASAYAANSTYGVHWILLLGE